MIYNSSPPGTHRPGWKKPFSRTTTSANFNCVSLPVSLRDRAKVRQEFEEGHAEDSKRESMRMKANVYIERPASQQLPLPT
jgi:hypothetical protein